MEKKQTVVEKYDNEFKTIEEQLELFKAGKMSHLFLINRIQLLTISAYFDGKIEGLNEMYKMGCKKENMVAKISGGADIMQLNLSNTSIGQRNVEFAKEFCRSEGFKVLSEHTRGEHGRLILLADNFDTFIKVTQKSDTDSKILSDEKKLQTEITKAPVIKEYSGAVEIFGAENKEIEPQMEIELF